jgi:hypothetical protein
VQYIGCASQPQGDSGNILRFFDDNRLIQLLAGEQNSNIKTIEKSSMFDSPARNGLR